MSVCVYVYVCVYVRVLVRVCVWVCVCFRVVDPRLAGSNPAEVHGFFQDVKILSTSPPGGTLSWGSRV